MWYTAILVVEDRKGVFCNTKFSRCKEKLREWVREQKRLAEKPPQGVVIIATSWGEGETIEGSFREAKEGVISFLEKNKLKLDTELI